ncbi:MAG: hypothetical protein JWO50_808 [Candidatus Kaiserbacteria bacterium]|nr:hypothetical protein [Candidatus Kaiserbacteria bacterium]
MKKPWILVFALVVIIICIVFVWMRYSTKSGLNPAVLPLYSGVSWSVPQAKVFSNIPVYEVASVSVSNITNLSEKSLPFTKYYDEKLLGTGWTRDLSREAGGPGSGVSFYTKGKDFVIIAYQSTFHVTHTDAPSECPCDLQFLITTGSNVGTTSTTTQ